MVDINFKNNHLLTHIHVYIQPLQRQGFCSTNVSSRDSNPGPVFSIPEFAVGGFLIPGSRRDYGIPGGMIRLISKPLLGLLSRPLYGPKLLNLRPLSRRHRSMHLG